MGKSENKQEHKSFSTKFFLEHEIFLIVMKRGKFLFLIVEMCENLFVWINISFSSELNF